MVVAEQPPSSNDDPSEEAIMAQALVLGGSMAGLLAARTLSDFYDTVTVVERDDLPELLSTDAAYPGAPHPRPAAARCART